MTHGYSLRSNAKGRKDHKSTEETDGQVRVQASAPVQVPAAQSKTASQVSSTRAPQVRTHPGQRTIPELPHKTRGLKHGGGRGPAAALTQDTSQTHVIPVVEGRRPRPEEPWEEIQAARKAKKQDASPKQGAARAACADRGAENECEVRVKRVRRKWELDWAIERGEVAVVVDEGVSSSSSMVVVGLDSNSHWEDADGKMDMAVDQNHAPTETYSPSWSRSESNFLSPAPAPAPVRKTQHQHQQPRMGPQGTFPLSGMGMGMPAGSGFSQLQAGTTATEKKHDDDNNHSRGPWPGEAHTGTSTSRRRTMRFPTLNDHPNQLGRKSHSSRPHQPQPQPQPLRRQQAQLMGIPTGTSEPSHGLDT
ncbi:hypothetical protein BGY98DRAFT_1179980 [Russula aff. rugulosa BPL654]|nr:hypothetical protein BGY98DRAFT_1179980 [Russula aff. rugulosa BPL654]